MYESIADPYCYPDSTVLKNRQNIRDQATLDEFELMMTALRSEEPLPAGRLSYAHYRAIHRHLFGDVFAWAGRARTVRISKGDSAFCYPENIDSQMRQLFENLRRDSHFGGLPARDFAAVAAHFLAELNAIHPFREGNGRTQLSFLTILAARAGHPLDFDRLDPKTMLDAMATSFSGDERSLSALIERLIA